MKRRDFVKKTAYVAPAIVTLNVIPTLAAAGSSRTIRRGNEGVGNGIDPPPPGHSTNQNDYPGTGPGHPGRRR